MNEMAQKKKVPVATKSQDKGAPRKATAPAKSPANSVKAAKSAVKAKTDVKSDAVRKPAAPVVAVKAKAAPVAAPAAKVAKKGPMPIKIDVKAPMKPASVQAKKPVGPAPAIAPKAPAAVIPTKAATGSAPQRALPAAIQKPVGQKITAPIAAPAPVQTPKGIAEKTAAARQLLAAQKKPVNQRHGFKANEFIVYPAHGVGRIIGIEEQEIAGMSLELFVINFEKEKLTLRVPTGKLASVGMRKLADDGVVKKAMDILKGRARIKRTMWSRRAQEYVAKINSGDLISIAEVVRDLYRSEAQPEQSYSERQLYEDALDRMAREIAAVEKLDERGAVQRITEVLSKSAKSRRLSSEGEAVGEAA